MKKLFENWRKSLNEAEYEPGRAVADIDTGEDFIEPEMAEKETMQDLADKFNVQVMFAKTTGGKDIAVATFESGERMAYIDEEEMYQDLASRQEMNEEMDEFGAGWRDERGDPDDWDHVYDEDNLSFEDRDKFVEAYNIIGKAVESGQLPESVEDAVFDMLGRLGINLQEIIMNLWNKLNDWLDWRDITWTDLIGSIAALTTIVALTAVLTWAGLQ